MGDDPVREISASEAASAARTGAFLLDVREPEEWEAGRAPGAYHIPLGSLAARVDELPAEREIVVVCRAGGRSMVAATALQAAGFRVANLAGGMHAWAAEGLEVVADGGAGVVA